MKTYIFIKYTKKYTFVTTDDKYKKYQLYKELKQHFPNPNFVAVLDDPDEILSFSNVTNLDNCMLKYTDVVDKIVHMLLY